MRSPNNSLLKLLGLFALCAILIYPPDSATFAYVVEELPINDGIVQENEYSSSSSFLSGVFQIYWTINDSTIYVGMIGQTTGWIAVGFDPTTSMLDADLYYGWIENNGTVILYDAISLNAFGSNHPKDVNNGGVDNILEYNGTEDSGITTIEFSRNLTTGDDNDNDIPNSGTIDIIWAIGNADSFTTPHSQRGEATLTISQETETTGSETTGSDSTTTSTTDTTDAETTPGFELIVLFVAIGILLLKKREKRRK
jgi:hypothetical protein